MEKFRIKNLQKFGSVAFNSLVLLLTTSQAHSTTGSWICGSGAWEDPSCWDYTDDAGGDPGPVTPDMMDIALLISTDGMDRTVIRSTPHDPGSNFSDYPAVMTTIDATGSGTMTVVHAAGWAGDFNSIGHIVGDSGTGTLTQEGGQIIGGMVLGNNAGSSGTYNLIDGGAGTEALIRVGRNGNGVVNQSGGGVSFADMNVGEGEGSNGIYNLDGGHLTIELGMFHGTSRIGDAGTGVFNQTDGSHYTGASVIVGGKATGNGTYNLSGGEVASDMRLIVGDEGTGVFRQTGGEVKTWGIPPIMGEPGGLIVGNENGGNGTYELAGGTLRSDRLKIEATIGNAGTGVFNQSGGTFDITHCGSPRDCSERAGTLNIARKAGSTGAYNLSGGSSTSDFVNVGMDGHGEFNQSGGSNVVHDTLTVGSGGPTGSGVYNMSGGALVASNIVVNSNGAFNTSASGIDAEQFTNGGQLALVDPSVDTTIVGNYLQLSDGILELGARISRRRGFENSSLNVGGTATLGGTLDFSLDFAVRSLAVPSKGMDRLVSLFEFDLLSAETILGEFDFLNLPDLGALDPFFDWNISYILSDLDTDYVRLSMVRAPRGGPAGGPPIAHAPEPATLLLMVPALAGIGFASRKKKCA